MQGDPPLTPPWSLEQPLRGTGGLHLLLLSSIPHWCVPTQPRQPQSRTGVGVRGSPTPYNGRSHLLKVGLSPFSSHLHPTVISALLLQHRGPFDKSLCTGTKALFPHERNIFKFFFFFLITFTVHWLGRPSFSFPSESCCTPSGSGTPLGQQTATLQSPLSHTLACQALILN